MTNKHLMLVCAGSLVTTGTALADEYDPVVEDGSVVTYDIYDYSWYDARKATGIGVGMTIGGGFAGFTDGSTDALIDAAGAFNLRLLVGSHIPLGLELGYTATAGDMRTVGLDDADLSGNALDAVARWNILPHYAWTPFAFLGIGWQNYSADFIDTFVFDPDNDDVNMAALPMGVGVAYRANNGLTVDVRGTFRPVDDPEAFEDTRFSLDTWEATAAIGYDM